MKLLCLTAIHFAFLCGLSCRGTRNQQGTTASCPVIEKIASNPAKVTPKPEDDVARQIKEDEAQARTLFGKWERVSADADIGFSDEQVFGVGVRVAPKTFFLGDPDPAGRYFHYYWSWNGFKDREYDDWAKLAIEPAKGSLPRAFRLQASHTTLIFHVLSTGNRAELWVRKPRQLEQPVRDFVGLGRTDPGGWVFAGYYEQKDSVNRFQMDDGEVEFPKIQAKSLEDVLRDP